MIITGIEIIRGTRATYRCECIECGYLLESAEHCSGLLCPRCGGQMRRAERPGPGEPRSVGVSPPGKLELTYGDTLRIATSFGYRGPATDITLYGSIGNRRGFPTYDFDEIISNEVKLKTPDSQAEFVPVTPSVDIPITGNIAPQVDYDIYCKIKEYPGAGMPEVDDVIEITGIPPTFELLEETVYPYAYVYDGPCEQFIFTFKSDPFTPASWIKGALASHCEEEIKKQGGRVMEMRVYVDKSPLLWADWRIEIVGIPPATTGTAMPLAIAWWVAFIIVVIGLIALIIVTYTFIIKPLTYKHKPISEEIKATWSRDSLISVIGDFEQELERTPTPPEELEKKTDQELRDYCDELAEAIVPPEGAGLGLAIAAAGILGLGALAVMAMGMGKPEEQKGR